MERRTGLGNGHYKSEVLLDGMHDIVYGVYIPGGVKESYLGSALWSDIYRSIYESSVELFPKRIRYTISS